MVKVVSLIWLAFISGLAAVPAQKNVSLLEQVARPVQQSKPEWKLVNSRISTNKKYGAYRWESGKSFVNVLVLVEDTAADANKRYHNFDLEAFGLKRRELKGTVLELGDQNYAWEDLNDPWKTGIDFRKGRVFVHLTASSIDTAKQFAFLIADALPAS